MSTTHGPFVHEQRIRQIRLAAMNQEMRMTSEELIAICDLALAELRRQVDEASNKTPAPHQGTNQ